MHKHTHKHTHAHTHTYVQDKSYSPPWEWDNNDIFDYYIYLHESLLGGDDGSGGGGALCTGSCLFSE